MLEQRLRTEAGTGWTGPAYEHKQMRKMVATLALLVLSLALVLVRDHQFWFGAEDTATTDQAVTAPASSVATPAPVAPATKAVVQASVAPAVSARAAKRPLAVEVTGSKVHRSPATTVNSLKVQTVPAANPAAESSASWSPVTNAAERVRMTDAAMRQPWDASYPLLAQQMKVEGSVVLQVIIGADGVIQNLRVLSGPPILASAAREAVRNWRFKPYVVDGQAVETSATVTVNLTIKVLDNTANTAAQGKFPHSAPPS